LVDEFVDEGVPGQEPVYGDEEAYIKRAMELSIKEQAEQLGLTNSEMESDEEVSPEINAGTQDEGQAGPNPGDQDKRQARPNPGIQDEGKAGSNPGDVA
ncbi:hypothetical protein Tco_1553306, partial [Tanacetum coccineum]